ncbi:G-protein alpha subunit-domain-containing protein [Xylariaceae sp. FL0016]|nr:G-protein alpha subunit-domain-containing protein [Xylariaceae sp. FL0016]
MDPASAVGLASAVVGIGDVITKSLKSLLDLESRFQDADLKIMDLVGQLSTLKAALNHVSWFAYGSPVTPSHRLLIDDLSVTLRCCEEVVAILDDRIQTAKKHESSGVTDSGGNVAWWEESTADEYMGFLDNQITALNLLLTAFQWLVLTGTVSEQGDLLEKEESRKLLDRVKDDTSSLLGQEELDDSDTIRSSWWSQDLTPTQSDFNGEVLTSKAYRRATITAMVGAVLAGRRSAKSSSMASSRGRLQSTQEVPLILSPDLSQDESGRFSTTARSMRSISVPEVTKLGSSRPTSSASNSWAPFTSSRGNSFAFKIPYFSKALLPEEHRLLVKSRGPTSLKYLIPVQPNKQPLPTIAEPPSSSIQRVTLCGIAGSGKTTLMNSVLASRGQLDAAARASFSQAVKDHTMWSMASLVRVLQRDVELGKVAARIAKLPICLKSRNTVGLLKLAAGRFDAKGVEALVNAMAAWSDPYVRTLFRQKKHVYGAPDNAEYFLHSASRVSNANYIPTIDDIRRVRIKDSQTSEFSLAVGETAYHIVDPSSAEAKKQRRQRRKEQKAQTSPASPPTATTPTPTPTTTTTTTTLALTPPSSLMTSPVAAAAGHIAVFALDISLYHHYKMVEQFELWEKTIRDPDPALRCAQGLVVVFTKADHLSQEFLERYPFSDYYARFEGGNLKVDDILQYVAGMLRAMLRDADAREGKGKGEGDEEVGVKVEGKCRCRGKGKGKGRAEGLVFRQTTIYHTPAAMADVVLDGVRAVEKGEATKEVRGP